MPSHGNHIALAVPLLPKICDTFAHLHQYFSTQTGTTYRRVQYMETANRDCSGPPSPALNLPTDLPPPLLPVGSVRKGEDAYSHLQYLQILSLHLL
jgi:hypothetical protein